jgi:hypothetical protein
MPAATLNVAYVRYVGPGLRGGKMFLVPAVVRAPRRLLTGRNPYAPAHFTSEPAVCLLTIGGASGGAQTCALRQLIEHPIGFAVVQDARFAGIPLSIARRICGHLTAVPHVTATGRPRAVAVCVERATHPRFAVSPPPVITGVVGDAVASVDVYTRSGREVLAGVPVHNNVYVFGPGGAVTGVLKLVFKDAAGRVVPSTPAHFGAIATSISAAAAPALVGHGGVGSLRTRVHSATATTAASP